MNAVGARLNLVTDHLEVFVQWCVYSDFKEYRNQMGEEKLVGWEKGDYKTAEQMDRSSCGVLIVSVL